MAEHKPRFDGVFVTGTDTGVGKTRICVGLMEALKKRGLRVGAMKPVATGCDPGKKGLVNPDAAELCRHASFQAPYALINPYAFAAPVSPHIAAGEAGRKICLARIAEGYARLREQSDFVVVEGIGGWEVPLNPVDRVADLARILGLPVLMVVGLRLGCLNHAFLTAKAVRDSGCELIGWVGNGIDRNFTNIEENRLTLETHIAAPVRGFFGYCQDPDMEDLSDGFAIDDWLDC